MYLECKIFIVGVSGDDAIIDVIIIVIVIIIIIIVVILLIIIYISMIIHIIIEKIGNIIFKNVPIYYKIHFKNQDILKIKIYYFVNNTYIC